jgi:hypothetical protein
VYVGPTLDPAATRTHLPGAQLMAPIRRGDLYRDRLLGFTVFVILDGVFFQQLAVSPREIVDVLQDGGVVVGASSMGAIRAAECWPAGMHGVGTIYCLYRRGCLSSEDDVAVAFSAAPPYAAATVPLVNVRHTVGRARRCGLVTPAESDRLVQAAARCHYAERCWPDIARAADRADLDGELRTLAEAHDLKRADAVRALRQVRTWTTQRPHLLTDRAASPSTFRRRGAARENAEAVVPPVDTAALRRWLLASGLYRRYVTGPGRSGPTTAAIHENAEAVFADLADLAALRTLRWRFAAHQKAVGWARHQRLSPSADDHVSAGHDIAAQHGFADWGALRSSLAGVADLWRRIEAARDELALAERARRALFAGGGGEGAEPTSESRRVRD